MNNDIIFVFFDFVFNNADKIIALITKITSPIIAAEPKERRHYLRKSGPYETPFGRNTNRIRREISTGTGRSAILMSETFHRVESQNYSNWISNSQVVNDYNGTHNIDLRDYIIEVLNQ